MDGLRIVASMWLFISKVISAEFFRLCLLVNNHQTSTKRHSWWSLCIAYHVKVARLTIHKHTHSSLPFSLLPLHRHVNKQWWGKQYLIAIIIIITFRIVRFVLLGPVGARVSLPTYIEATGAYAANITWHPDPDQAGRHFMSYHAFDSFG